MSFNQIIIEYLVTKNEYFYYQSIQKSIMKYFFLRHYSTAYAETSR